MIGNKKKVVGLCTERQGKRMLVLTKADLIAFEADIAREFEAGHIRAPVHLSGGNEEYLLHIFQDVRPGDWVFSTWRNHYHAHLKGVTPEELKAAIMGGRSMYFCSLKHKFICSSIVGGILPIALGVALGIKRRGLPERVWVFVGDMAARTGIFHEVHAYASGRLLPMRFVIEDNGLSTNTPTREAWGDREGSFQPRLPNVSAYPFQRVWPHVGVGKWVTFG